MKYTVLKVGSMSKHIPTKVQMSLKGRNDFICNLWIRIWPRIPNTDPDPDLGQPNEC
jgi:hypothetical protein